MTKSTRNHPSGSAILTTIFLLFGILVVSMIGIQIVMNGLAARRAQGASSKAFYASEAGIERAMNMYKMYGKQIMANIDCDTSTKKLNLEDYTKFCTEDKANYPVESMFGDISARYWVTGSKLNQTVSLNSRGSFSTTNRELFVQFCLPDCTNKGEGASDGCNGTCGK